MNEETAKLEAMKEWPGIEWHLACPVLPTGSSKIESASWLVLSKTGEYVSLVDGGPDSVLFKRQ